ncbi:hypothetical protein BJ165DRAFT_1428553 [Panaeolus papilionaceus]|nr:hypothetical protein BJ165DRAFT_1428553 [Panaeolus papilionaceus]
MLLFMPPSCCSCDREFSTHEHLQQHWRDSPQHHYCHVCEKHFGDESKLEEHALAEHPKLFCAKCALIFRDEDGLHHHRRRSAEHPYYCDECRLDFSSANALRQHRMSSTHRGKDHPCNLGKCPESFVSLAALVLHWEAGACVSGIDFVDVYHNVHDNDSGNHITCPSEYYAGVKPVRISDVENWTTRRSLNCIICGVPFKFAHQAMQHFNSTHIGRAFKCPYRECDPVSTFSSLGGMLQHIASNACGGADNRWVRSKVKKAVKLIQQRYHDQLV